MAAVTLNHEGIVRDAIADTCKELAYETGLPVCDPIVEGAGPLISVIRGLLDKQA